MLTVEVDKKVSKDDLDWGLVNIELLILVFTENSGITFYIVILLVLFNQAKLCMSCSKLFFT